MEPFRTALVYVRNVFAGTLAETDFGYSFSYDNNYLKSDQATTVSLTLPLSDEPYNSRTLFPFFDGLIPEGWLLNVVEDNWKVNPNDRMSLLLLLGEDSIGAVSVKEVK